MFRFVVLLLAVGAVKATNYCSSTICSAGVTHIACGHSGNFASTCPATAAMVDMTTALKTALIDAHNAKRNFIAGGGDPNHDKACRMGTMSWDDEMASLAALNVKQCQMAHDKCRNTDAFKYSGQNLAWMGYYDPVNHQSMLEWAVQLWYDEVKDSNRGYIAKYPKNYTGPTIGHYTVMMNEKNIKLGCAAATYPVTGQPYKAYLVACNYASTNMIDNPIYKSCATAASGCTTGTNPTYPNLCSASEVFNVNAW